MRYFAVGSRVADRIFMPGRFIEIAVRSLDRLAVVFGRQDESTTLPQHLRTGDRGEETAYFHLRRNGYVMVARKFRSARTRGDIDLIGWDGKTLCFIEVKTRTTRDVKPPEAAVDREKRAQIARVARQFLGTLPEVPAFRFDLVTVLFEKRKAPEITLFRSFMTLP